MSTAISTWRSRILRNVPKAPIPIIDEAVLDTLRDFCGHTKIWTEQLTAIPLVAYTGEYDFSSPNGEIVEIDHAEINNSLIYPVSERLLDDKDLGWRDKTASTPTHYLMGHDRTIRLVYTPNEDSDVSYSLSDLTFDASTNTIATAAGNFVTAGLLAGHVVTVSGTTSNNRNLKVTNVSALTLTVEGGVVSEGTANASGTFTVNGLAVWVSLKPLLTATTIETFIYNDYLEVIADGARARLFSMAGTPWANGEYAGYFGKLYEAHRNKAANKKRTGLTKATSGGVSA